MEFRGLVTRRTPYKSISCRCRGGGKGKGFCSLPPSLFFFLRSIDAPFAPHVYTRVLLASIFEFNLFYMWIMDDLVTFSFFFIDIFVRLNLFLLELLHEIFKFALRESLIRDVTAKYGVEICLV